MFKRTQPEPTGLEEAIADLLSELKGHDTTSDEYAQTVKQLQKLHALKENERPSRVDPNTLLTVGANLAGILMIVGHERAHIVTSKAIQFVLKAR